MAEDVSSQPSYSQFYSDAGTWSGKLYFSPDDSLLWSVWNAAAGVTLALSYKRIDANGRIIQSEETMVPTTARALNTKQIFVGEGWLIQLVVRVLAGTPLQGQCFSVVTAQHGRDSVAMPWAMLISDYVSSGNPNFWPGGDLKDSLMGEGVIRSITGTDPAAGAEISEVVPVGARWQLLGVLFSLVTDATAVNRRAIIVLDDGVSTFFRYSSATNQGATLTFTYTASAIVDARAPLGGDVVLELPPRVLLLAGYRIRTVTALLQAADNYGAPQLWVREWLEV